MSMAGDQRFWLVGVKVLYMVRVWDGVLKEAVGLGGLTIHNLWLLDVGDVGS